MLSTSVGMKLIKLECYKIVGSKDLSIGFFISSYK